MLVAALLGAGVACQEPTRHPHRDKNSIENSVSPDLAEVTAEAPDLASSDLAKPKPKPDLFDPALSVTWDPVSTNSVLDSGPIVLSVHVDYEGSLDDIEQVVVLGGDPTAPTAYAELTRYSDTNTWSTTLSWALLNSKQKLEFGFPTVRTFYVTVVTKLGKAAATPSHDVTLACTQGRSACDGVCGGCGETLHCSNTVNEAQTCSQVCAAAGKSCRACLFDIVAIGYSTAACINDGTQLKLGGSCDTPLSNLGYTSYGKEQISCCCK